MYALRSRAQQKAGANVVFVDENIFPQTLAVMTTRAVPQGIELRVGKYKEFEPSQEVFACVLQYPNSNGSVEDYTEFTEKVLPLSILYKNTSNKSSLFYDRRKTLYIVVFLLFCTTFTLSATTVFRHADIFHDPVEIML